MICPKCGTNNNDSFNNYCVYCGAFLDKTEAVQVTNNNKGFGSKIFLVSVLTVGVFGISFLGGKFIKSANKEIKGDNYINIPYALNDIDAGEEITKGMVSYVKVSDEMIDEISFLFNESSLFNKRYCVKKDMNVMKDSYFYVDQIEECKSDTTTKSLNIGIEEDNTYYEYFKKGLYVDLYVKMKDRNADSIIYGKIFEGLEIDEIFQDSISVLIPNEYYDIMSKALKNKGIDINMVLVNIKDNKKIKALSSDYLFNQVKSRV